MLSALRRLGLPGLDGPAAPSLLDRRSSPPSLLSASAICNSRFRVASHEWIHPAPAPLVSSSGLSPPPLELPDPLDPRESASEWRLLGEGRKANARTWQVSSSSTWGGGSSPGGKGADKGRKGCMRTCGGG